MPIISSLDLGLNCQPLRSVTVLNRFALLVCSSLLRISNILPFCRFHYKLEDGKNRHYIEIIHLGP
jgi:hypothetical protein